MAVSFKLNYKVALIALAVSTIGLWIYDYTGKNVQMLEDTAIIAAGVLLGLYTFVSILKPQNILHISITLALFIISFVYFFRAMFIFFFYGFNGAKLPFYYYLILACNAFYIVISFRDGIKIATK